METIQDTGSPEVLPLQAELPVAEHLRDVYRMEMQSGHLPSSARRMNWDELPDVTIYNDSGQDINVSDPTLLPNLQAQFIENCVRTAEKESWWSDIQASLAYNAEIDGVPPVTARHTLTAEVNGVETSQAYQIIEMGTSAVSEQSLQTVIETIEIIDQFTGGRMVANANKGPIVLVSGIQFKDNDGGGEVAGYNSPKYTLINVSGIERVAQAHGIDPQELLSLLVVHEYMGHAFERTMMGLDETGLRFPEFFEYSDERMAGDIFSSIHAAIKAKDPLHTDSKPVREYGARDSHEDYATATEAAVKQAMGWKDTDKIPRFKSVPDPYRQDLVLELLGFGAQQAKYAAGTPGFVGSRVRYEQGDDGSVSVKPERIFKLTTVDGKTAVADEIAKVIGRHKQVETLLVNVKSLPG